MSPILVTLLGFVCLQAVRCDHHVTVTTTTYSYSADYSAMFYDESGSSILTSTYPYYANFGYRTPRKLTTDYDFNQKLSLYSALYNVPMSNLYQMYNIIENNMPTISKDQELSMLKGLASSIHNEKVRDYVNPYNYDLNPWSYTNSLSMAQLRGYLPSNLPASLWYMMNYIDSMLPSLNASTLAEIQNYVYQHTPAAYTALADDLTFQLQTSIRYMLANEMYWVASY